MVANTEGLLLPTYDEIIDMKNHFPELNTFIERKRKIYAQKVLEIDNSDLTYELKIPYSYLQSDDDIKISAIITGLSTVSSENTVSLSHPVAKDAIIYADDFDKLMTAINNLKLSTGACNSCITSCNVTCNTCNSCNSCISCNTCQSVTSYSSHYSSCDTPPPPKSS